MEEMFVRINSFHDEMNCIAEGDEDKRKIHILAFNLLQDLNFIIENAKIYEAETRWSMLDIRLEKNMEYKKRMENDIEDFRHKVNDIIRNGGLGAVKENTHDVMVISETEEISKRLSDISAVIFSQIMQNILYLDRMFSELVVLNVSRTDNDYAEIFERTKRKYESTEEFKGFKKSYIENLNKYFFDGKLVNAKQIKDIIRNRNISAMEDMDIGEIWSYAQNNPSMVARLFILRKSSDDADIKKFLRYHAEIELLKEWECYTEKYAPGMGKPNNMSDCLEFIAPYSEERLRNAWNEIHVIMDDNNVSKWEWCALYHALSVKHKINNVDFWTFMKWIQDNLGEEIITKEYYKKYSKNYFVVTNQEEWNLDNYKSYYSSKKDKNKRGSAFGEKQFNIYKRITNTIYKPLQRVLAK